MRTGIRIYLYRSYLFWLIICIMGSRCFGQYLSERLSWL